MKRWPLILLALPAAVATWSGWVGLGEKTGFGVVQLLPGIVDFEINTAITLPIGVEAYAAFALSAWLTSAPVGESTRRFAKWSALGALVLGMLGQVAFHLLEVAGYTTAPVGVTVAVACLPVLVLGMGAGLGHMLTRDAQTEPVEVATLVVPVEVHREPVVEESGTPGAALSDPIDVTDKPEVEPVEPVIPPQVADVPEPVRDVPEPTDLHLQAASTFFFDIAAGDVPGVRQIKDRLNIGQEKAQDVRAYLATLANA
ncbi:hypothetical protein [Streptosporangium sp. KLBMP 9127]|nr:hypothetical protein [Streptosporangium sp. KLBMP 9127]